MLAGLDKLTRAIWAGTFDVLYSTGFTVPQSQTWNFQRLGNLITIWPAAQVTGTSNSALFSTGADAIPAFLRPIRSGRFVADAIDNGAAVGCIVLLNAANGSISFGASLTSSLINNWTNAAVQKAFPNSATLSPYFTYIGAPT